MELPIFLAFVAATAIMIALPGPSVLLTVAHSISFGWWPALATVAGATAGIAVQLFIAAVGLTSLLNLAAQGFEWLRWAGAGYLIYLGIRQWKGAEASLGLISVSKGHLFVQGLVTTIFNPKSLIFIAAFLPQFVDLDRPAGMQFAIIVPTFLLITFSVTSCWALAAGKAACFFKGRAAFRNLLRAAGGLMVLSGLGLALARQSR